jgi:hypothetical protein
MDANKSSINPLNKITSKIIQFFGSDKAPWIIIGSGIILRIAQFLYNRSLTEAEAPIAMNIVHRSYSELLQPLDFTQTAPVGHSIIGKFFVEIFGNNEYTLRLFPLIAGIIALFLFYKIAKKIISHEALSISLILFAVNEHLIFFSSDVKQYSSDVAIALSIILMAFYVMSKKSYGVHMILFGLVGAISIWFSYPAVFTFYAALIIFLIPIIEERKWRSLAWLFIAGIIASMNLGINYFMTLEILSKSKDLLVGFQHSFMPLPPQSLKDLWWFIYVFLRIFKNPLGFSIYELILPVLSFIVGLVVIFYRKRKILWFLILPVLLTLIISGFKKYPFEGRLLLFITPAMILIIGAGIDQIRIVMSKISKVIGIALVILLLLYPVALACYRLVKPRAPEELRPVVGYLKEHKKDDDIIYLYYPTVKAYQYYAEKFGLDEKYIVGIESQYEWDNYYHDLENLKGNERVWALFSHIITWHGVDEEKLFLSYLNILGTRLDSFRVSGASIYLYDLSNTTE